MLVATFLSGKGGGESFKENVVFDKYEKKEYLCMRKNETKFVINP